jgi:SAM-dependent methyltransferase
MTGAEATSSEEVEVNRRHWNDRAGVHEVSDYYDLAGLVAHGPRPICGPDEDEVGPVAGKALLHLHCHIGTDSLRWAALGARVTGVDISDRSIDIAVDLARRLCLPATFVRADALGLDDVLTEPFDVVYASYGVICWVEDIDAWMRAAARWVGPSGFFYLAEGHPFDVALGPDRYQRSGYFDRGGRRFEDRTSYTDGSVDIAAATNYRWHHTLGDVVTAVARSGLQIEFVHENPWCLRQSKDNMVQDSDGRWHVPGDPHPLGFSIRATAPTSTTTRRTIDS